MFNYGKENVHFEQFCKLVNIKLYKKPQKIVFEEPNTLSKFEYENLYPNLLIFKFVVFNLLLLKTTMMIKTNRNGEELGNIWMKSLKQLLKEYGNTQYDIDVVERMISKQMDYQFELLSKLDIRKIDSELMKKIVSIGFTKYFGNLFGFSSPNLPNGEINIDSEKEATLFYIAMEVYKIVEQIFLEKQAIYKIVDL